MQDVRVVFMGTPDFSINPLKTLISKTNVVLVVTKKDAYVGRKKILTPSPVKEFAIKSNIPVITPSSIKKSAKEILKYKPDLIVTCAYGKILPKELIDYPTLGCLNLHASLLPKYRGSAPIQWALINGEKTTGITLMYMDENMDTGDIIDKIECEITEEDNCETLHNKLSELSSVILLNNLDNIVNGKINRVKQNDNEATYAPMIERNMEELDFNDKVKNVFNKIRAFSPEPLTKTKINGEEIKIVKSHYELTKSIVNKLYVDKKSMGIGCQDGIIYFDIIKPIGKNNMNVKNYLNGKKELWNERR